MPGTPSDADTERRRRRRPSAPGGERTRTAPKGKPTPKRSEAGRKRGPVAPAPMTSAEARKRRKETAGPKLSREERKAEQAGAPRGHVERRERMMAGEDAYLLPRDRGPVRRYVRDVVDSRRNLLGLFMPSALVPDLRDAGGAVGAGAARCCRPAMLVLVLIMVDRRLLPGPQGEPAGGREVPGQHRNRLEARLLRRQPRLAAASDACAAAAGRARRQRRVTPR